MPKEFYLHLIGGIRLHANDGVPTPISRKALALLAYLSAGPQQSASRDLLAGLLWSDVPNANARASLRQILSELRGLPSDFADCVQIERDYIHLERRCLNNDVDTILGQLESGVVPEILRTEPNLSDRILYGFENISQGFEILDYGIARFHNVADYCTAS